MQQSCIALLIKQPVPGKVKTRLISTLGSKGASECYKTMVTDTITKVKQTQLPVFIFVYPPEAVSQLHHWLGKDIIYAEQQGVDLGERMKSAFIHCFSQGYSKVLLMGSDLPDLPVNMILEGVTILDNQDAVIGPAEDGGYYLIGFNTLGFTPAIFYDIPWGTKKVYNLTINQLQQDQKSVGILPCWHDIDTPQDLEYILKSQQTLQSKQWLENYLNKKNHPITSSRIS